MSQSSSFPKSTYLISATTTDVNATPKHGSFSAITCTVAGTVKVRGGGVYEYVDVSDATDVHTNFIDPSTGAVTLVEIITQDTSSAALPITDSILDEITYAQSGDIMFLCHHTFMIRKLVRTSLNDFEVSIFAFDKDADDEYNFQPYYSFHGEDVTLDPSATTGAGVTLTTSVPYWDTT